VQVTTQATKYKCDKCGEPMVIRQGKRGPFLACTGYPKCKNAKDVDAEGKPVEQPSLGINCDKCGKPMAVKKSFRGPFLGCTGFPGCRSTKQITDEIRQKLNLPAPPAKKPAPQVEITETCPKCNGPMKLRQGTKGWFLGCGSYPKCKGVREAPASVLEQVEAESAAS
jgi:DNA topoisomerase-1